MSWNRLIRFVGEDGQVHRGEPNLKDAQEIPGLLENDQLSAEEFVGNDFTTLSPTGKTLQVKKLLGPLAIGDVPIIRCIGLNYTKHIHESGRQPPPYPSVFIKPPTSVADWDEDVPIPKLAQDDQCDYEGELAIVIGETGKDIPSEEALEFVAGYVASNDVSARKWQRDPAYAGMVPQWCFSKGFDKYAPMGPVLVSTKILGAADSLQLQTFVNGEIRQDSNTSDLLFGVRDIVSFVSRGTTLEKGTVIMTGTPAGVAMGMKPPKYLQHGDLVEVKIEQLGTLRNRMMFE